MAHRTRKNPLNAVCSACLSTDRILKPLSKDLDIFLWLRDVDDMHSKMYGISLCYECRAILRRVHVFRARVQQAHRILAHSVKFAASHEFVSLSSLQLMQEIYIIDTNIEIKQEFEIKDIPEDDKTEIVLKNNISDDDFVDNMAETDAEFKMEEMDGIEKSEEIDIKKENACENDDNISQKPSDTKLSKKDGQSLKIKPKTKAESENYEHAYKSNYEIIPAEEFTSKHYTEVELTENDIKSCNHYLRERFKCQECEIGFSKYVTFRKHSYPKYHHVTDIPEDDRKITPNKGYTCDICNKKTLTKLAQKRHLLRFHKKIISCKKCEETTLFKMIRDFKPHYYKMHNKYICDYCGATKTLKRTLIDHITRFHKDKYECDICKKCFTNHNRLLSHRYTHGVSVKHDKKDPKELRYCVECNIEFESVFKYTRHIKTSIKHVNRRYESCPCPYCGKIFSRKSFMNNHIKLIHENSSKHHCDLCDKYFINGGALRTHTKLVHLKIALPKNKICNVCGRAFAGKNVLERHMLTHTGERPHQCPECPASFTQKYPLKTHLQKIHGKLL